MREIKTKSAENFRKEGVYTFPFDVLDKTEGGSNLGRIMWQVEPIKGKKKRGRYYIEKLLVWASQTRDEKYSKQIFEIPCFAECITGDSLKRESYLNYVWRVLPCEVHKETVFSAYPANHHSKLIINISSSISIDIDFI